MIFVRILKAIIIIMILQGSLDKLVMRILSGSLRELCKSRSCD